MLPARNETSTGILPDWLAGTLIPVDLYYLVHRAEELGYHPQVILAGRAINDSMPAHVAGMMIRGLNEAGKVIKAIFSQKSSKNCPPGGVIVFGQPAATWKGSIDRTPFHLPNKGSIHRTLF